VNILITGGAGYIGSHTVVELLDAGHRAVVVDDLSNSSIEVIERLQKISGKQVPCEVFDIRNKAQLQELFKKHRFDAVVHFAGLKPVGESTQKPLIYYRVNIDATLTLLEVMQEYNVHNLVFSSSATVYGTAPIPYLETSQTGVGITNPYGQTKYMIEQILKDTAAADPSANFAILRYFNPIGAHASGLVGEDPRGVPNNIMPYITQVATGKRNVLSIFGDDYPTVDGTGVRDYIHVVDLAKGHVAALDHLQKGLSIYNLGTGHGTSVLQLVRAFEAASSQKVPYKIVPRRPGDLPEYYANVDKARHKLGWKAELSVEKACLDSWNWQSLNPDGYSNSMNAH
jgi:UDP-glucose 4-epimerase